MAKLVTIVRTYFEDGRYRNNRIEVDIPSEAVELIKKHWEENGVQNCTTAKYLASNQAADALLFEDDNTENSDKSIAGMSCMGRVEMEEDEIYMHRFKDDECNED